MQDQIDNHGNENDVLVVSSHRRIPSQKNEIIKRAIFDYIVFAIAIMFLVAILVTGFSNSSVQTNILYLVVLSLACAMVFAFLPFDAGFQYKSVFKAGGTAAIFAFCLLMVKDFTEKDFVRNKLGADAQITALQTSLTDRDKQIEILRGQVGKLGESSANAKNEIGAISGLIGQISGLTGSLRSDLNEGVQFSSAARDNSSDSRTCSLRGSQSLSALSRAVPKVDSIQSNLNSLASLIK